MENTQTVIYTGPFFTVSPPVDMNALLEFNRTQESTLIGTDGEESIMVDVDTGERIQVLIPGESVLENGYGSVIFYGDQESCFKRIRDQLFIAETKFIVQEFQAHLNFLIQMGSTVVIEYGPVELKNESNENQNPVEGGDNPRPLLEVN